MDRGKIFEHKIIRMKGGTIKGIVKSGNARRKDAIQLFQLLKEAPLIRENPKIYIKFLKLWKKTLKNYKK